MDSWTKLWMNQVGMIFNQSEIDISICVLRIFIIAAIIFAFRKMNFLEIQKFEFQNLLIYMYR